MEINDQVMWGHQLHFQFDLKSAAAEALSSIGVSVAPTALLIGFEEDPGGPPICVEPEGLGIAPGIFADSASKGDAAYEAHENRRMFMSNRGLHERFHADLLDRCRADAIAETMNSHADHDSRRWFVGCSVRVGRYRVYPVVGVRRSKWDALPALTLRDRDHRTEMYLSLQEAVVWELLHSATFALSISDQPEGLRYNDRDEVIRRASTAFVRKLVQFKGNFMGVDLNSAMNLVAAQPYEGRTGVGTMLMGADNDYVLELTFENPINLNQTRGLRKALEMTDPQLHLVTNGKIALGLGRLADGYSSDFESAFFLRVIGRGSWELMHDDVALLVVTDGHASVPQDRLARATFDDAVGRLFGAEGDAERLWDLALAASLQAHGTMLVVHADAGAEAMRLSPPAMRVTPGPLTDSTLLAVSAIDGAIIVDPGGQCHAVGAILDGRAVRELGDASRGARFNSAHRYLAEAKGECLIIIVSEDGMLNIIPDLPRRVKKSYVESVLAAVESLSHDKPIDFEAFRKREEHLWSLEFYLTSDQCARGNESRERVEQFRESSAASHDGLGGIARIGYDLLEPNPNLNKSFFLPESEL